MTSGRGVGEIGKELGGGAISPAAERREALELLGELMQGGKSGKMFVSLF